MMDRNNDDSIAKRPQGHAWLGILNDGNDDDIIDDRRQEDGSVS